MKITPSDEIADVLEVSCDVFGDARGYFFESYSQKRYAEHGLSVEFVQDNVSRSQRGILRGLHMQSPPSAQGKLVSCVLGEVYDVAVDVRVGSPTFGKFVARYLSPERKNQLYIPPGFAHGFCVTSEDAIFSYKCTTYYDPKAELSVAFDDPAIGIPWPIEKPVLSKKDAEGGKLAAVPEERLLRFVSKS
jgi:dTDP-4-dehydrorhamnose 3,5-epimerase